MYMGISLICYGNIVIMYSEEVRRTRERQCDLSDEEVALIIDCGRLSRFCGEFAAPYGVNHGVTMYVYPDAFFWHFSFGRIFTTMYTVIA